MPDSVSRGGTISLDAFYRDGTYTLVDPTTPRVSIVDANNTTVVNLATPTQLSTGHYGYDYAVADNAPLGAWEAVWYGIVNGYQVGPVSDGFTVVGSGSVSGDTFTGPCSPWATTADVCTPCEDVNDGVMADALEMASELLYVLSGRQFSGVCSDTIRPDRLCRCSDQACRCNTVEELILPGLPVVSITSVKVDGVTLASSRYRIDNHRALVRLADADGTNPGWPCCQRMDLASTEDETWEVAYTYGQAPPALGVRAAAKMACEIALACTGNSGCTLSSRVQSITRQGVTVAIDSLDSIREDLTGLPEVDMFLNAYNPGKLRRQATIFSPDTVVRHRRTNT